MSIYNFLQFNKNCPVCNNPLGLYMQWIRSAAFKAELVEEHKYEFVPFMKSNEYIGAELDGIPQFMLLYNSEIDFNIAFSTNKLFNESKKYQIYFYYLCNTAGLISHGSYGGYEINLFNCCYYRSSPTMEFQKSNVSMQWELVFLDINKILINKEEAFSFEKMDNDIHKIYMLNLDYENKQTILYYYTSSPEQRKDKFFKPKIFTKYLPLLKNRINLEDRDKLLKRFDTWIILS